MFMNHIVTNITKRELPNGASILTGVSDTITSPMLFDLNLYGMTVVFPRTDIEILSNELIDAICLHEYGHIKAGYRADSTKLFVSSFLFYWGICDKYEIEADRETLRYTSLLSYQRMIEYIRSISNRFFSSDKIKRKYDKVLKNRYKRTLSLERESL